MQKDYTSFPPIGIIAYSDFYKVPEPKVWGDYWFKENLIKEFRRLGCPVDNSNPKILLHLFGEPLKNVLSDTYNILWIHSHPDWTTPEILRKYRKIYCVSKPFNMKIAEMGFDSEFMMIPTNMKPVIAEKIYDIVFVGNTKQNKTRKIISDMGNPPYNIKIWGWGWKGLIPDEWYGGEYYENDKLNTLYASSKIALNDHHEDMQREGFINPRVLDILASGGFAVSDEVAGMDKLLNNGIVVYKTPEELRRKIRKYMEDDAGRESFAERGRKIALTYTYQDSCLNILRHIETISAKLSL
jgi:spore maturation protein CgeB